MTVPPEGVPDPSEDVPRPRVLSYPPRHPYVDRLRTVASLVHRDEPWPRLPHLYDPTWVAAAVDDADAGWDLVHLHFTWEQYPLEQVEAVLDVHLAAGRRLVWTAHDLRNPHTGDLDDDVGYLRCLAERADAVTTLSRTAADDLRARYGRDAEVLPHGPLLTDDQATTLRAAPRPSGPPTVLLHAKSLRRNLEVATAVAVAHELAAAGHELRLLVSVHDEPQVRATLAGDDRDGVELWWHAPLDHDELAAAVADADVLLLPYRWGTHSGLLELANDVGTPVIASDVGALAEQGAAWTVPVVDGHLDADALRSAFVDATTGALPGAVPWSARTAARDAFLDGYARLYARLLPPRTDASARR